MDKKLTTPEDIEAIEITENNENCEMCSKCKGVCCMSMGCDIFPQDVKRWFGTTTITKEMIIKLLDSNMVQLDWWDGDVRVDAFNYDEDTIEEYHDCCYYLHMRNKYEAAIQGSYGGMCRALGEHGCRIPWDKRPTGGKALVPSTTGSSRDCKVIISKPENCLAWLPYSDILEAVRYEYKIPDGEDRYDYMDKELHAGADRFKPYEM